MTRSTATLCLSRQAASSSAPGYFAVQAAGDYARAHKSHVVGRRVAEEDADRPPAGAHRGGPPQPRPRQVEWIVFFALAAGVLYVPYSQKNVVEAPKAKSS